MGAFNRLRRRDIKIGAIGHASYLFETAAGTVLTDPVFFDPFEGGANTSYPPRAVDATLLPKLDCVVLSHRHFDHFDIRTLSTLDRKVMVFYPAGEELIEKALTELGFHRRRGLHPWSKARTGALELIATPSRVEWPELGLIIRDGHTTVWSLIDTIVDGGVVDTAREQVGKVDCLLAQYCPLLQYELRDPTSCKNLDVVEYEQMLSMVRLADPDIVIPSAGGLRYAVAGWQDCYGFPVTPTRFLSDLRLAGVSAEGVVLDPGDSCERLDSGWVTRRQAAPCVRRTSFDDYALWQHNPAVGIPPFIDSNPLFSPSEEAYEFALRYITGQLIDDLLHPANADALASWRRWRLTWRLDLYAPEGTSPSADGSQHSWWLTFDDEPLLRPTGPIEVDLRTAAAATGIYDVLRGRCSAYGFLFLDRIRHTGRIYATDPKGVQVPENVVPEPLLTALAGHRDLDDAFVTAQLEEWHARND